ncbi:VWA domain-containing protein [Dactylosporangium cerinum]|uniref:VWA domain-containing protein n=2 Tax=Dactylosporangium cerinum TaxID=1434730 RepID=A0ABV9WAY5_9ACTN
MSAGALPESVDMLIRQLRGRGLPLGIDDCQALRTALGAGFGWGSSRSFHDLCVALWAKSPRDAAIIGAVLARIDVTPWLRVDPLATGDAPPEPAPGWPADPDRAPDRIPDPGAGPETGPDDDPPSVGPAPSLSATPPASGLPGPPLVLVPQYPVTEREAIQIWRGLRRNRREGPPVQLDVDGTVDRRCRLGLPTPPVLLPARLNTARLTLLVDRSASMMPYHEFVEHLEHAIGTSARMARCTIAYFRNVLGHSQHRYLLGGDGPVGRTALDAVLPVIPALQDGTVFRDRAMTALLPFAELIDGLDKDTGVAVVSDAGAARGGLSPVRLLDSVAGLKALTARAGAVVWLNPSPSDRWRRTTAGRIARHVPMHPLTVDGMHRAVDVLRGRQTAVERPL